MNHITVYHAIDYEIVLLTARFATFYVFLHIRYCMCVYFQEKGVHGRPRAVVEMAPYISAVLLSAVCRK